LRKLTVSFGSRSPAVIDSVSSLTWAQFSEWLCAEPPEVADKAARGWYIPADFNPRHRDSENFVGRDAITYDFDHVNIDTWGDVINAWSDTTFAMYTTFSHRPDKARFRVVMPLSRPAGFDEFQAVARKVAADVGLDLFAGESFVPAQMMFCPTRTLGGMFVSHINTGIWLDVDNVLAEYADWRDVAQWPRRATGDSVHAGTAKADPLDKPGIIGAFNRAFSIEECISKFDLPYERVS
jgi:putative DNA primase/helicase